MKFKQITSLFIAISLLAVANAHGQKFSRREVAQMAGDIGAMKQLAENGDMIAQVALANAYDQARQSLDALVWYRKAAEQGSAEAAYRVGNKLLFGDKSRVEGQEVNADVIVGIKWMYRAATNRFAPAYGKMAIALEHGLGLQTNSVLAHAWYQISGGDPNSVRAELNRLTLKMTTDEIRDARAAGRQLKQGIWPELVLLKKPQPKLAIKLNGVSIGGRSSLAILNKQTLAAGESANIQVDKKIVRITCLKIEQDSVLITVAGEDEPRLLSLN